MARRKATTDMSEQEKEVEALFEGYDATYTVGPTIWKGKPAVEIVCGGMYNRPTYKGDRGMIGMLENLMRIGGGNRIDDDGDTDSPGCETCDYGSFYSKRFIVWTEDDK